MSPNTIGSTWGPYEYGRIADDAFADKASCWLHPDIGVIPEYLYLRKISRKELDIQNWFNSYHRGALVGCNATWNQSTIPTPLP